MKKLLSLLLALALCLSLAACAKKAPAESSSSAGSASAGSSASSEKTDSSSSDAIVIEPTPNPDPTAGAGQPAVKPEDGSASGDDNCTAESETGSSASSSENKPATDTGANKPATKPSTDTSKPATKPSTGTGDTSAQKPAGDAAIDSLALSDILDKLVASTKTDFGNFFSSYSLAAADAGYAIGYDGFSGTYKEALAYGPAIGSIPFVMVLFRLNADQDAAAFAEDLRTHANPAKWVCVQADYVEAEANGQTVLFLMASSESCPTAAHDAILETFRGF
jgi:predicted small lipoprotein YifL